MTGEEIVGIIPNTQSGFLGQKAYNLIVTNHRLIVAELTNDMIKNEMKKVKEDSKKQGDGFFTRWTKTMTSGANSYYKKYFSMPVENILNENPNNYCIFINNIKKIRVHNGYMHNEGKRIPNEIKIKWDNGKESFRFTSIESVEAKNILRKTFGVLVK
jgi:hypothetical protein